MLRILAILFLTIVYVWGEYRIVKMVPFGDGNLKIVFDQDIDDWDCRLRPYLHDNGIFVPYKRCGNEPEKNG